jgi:hypothetical protein
MDRKIEHRTLSLRTLLNNPDWNFGRLLYNGILLFFITLLIYLTFLYAISLCNWRNNITTSPTSSNVR